MQVHPYLPIKLKSFSGNCFKSELFAYDAVPLSEEVSELYGLIFVISTNSDLLHFSSGIHFFGQLIEVEVVWKYVWKFYSPHLGRFAINSGRLSLLVGGFDLSLNNDSLLW